MSSESLSSARMADYFVPVEAKKGGISSQVHRFSSETVLADYKVILIGLPDAEAQAGGVAQAGYKAADAIRWQLYGLSEVLDTHAVLDMGNIRSPLDKGVSNRLLATVLHYFLDRGCMWCFLAVLTAMSWVIICRTRGWKGMYLL